MTTIEELAKYVQKRKAEAYQMGMDYDIETDKFVPYPTEAAMQWERGDNAPEDPEQAGY